MHFQAENLQKSFGQKQVLKNVSFHVESGKALGLLGRNGAGKTTTIRIIMGVFPPDSGRILLDKEPLQRNKLKIGYLPEEHGLYPKKLVKEQLIYLGVLRGMKKTEAAQSVEKWMARLGVSEYLNRKLDTLSKGNQQKIQLVAALLTSPDLLILDEPFSGLDPVNSALLKEVVKEQISIGKTVIFSSHQMGYVEEFCDNIAILEQGEIVISGSIEEIKRSYDRSIMKIGSLQQSEIKSFCETIPNTVERTQIKDGNLLVKLKDASLKDEFLQILLQNKFDIELFAVYEPSLNDIFVQYTAGEADNSKKEAGNG